MFVYGNRTLLYTCYMEMLPTGKCPSENTFSKHTNVAFIRRNQLLCSLLTKAAISKINAYPVSTYIKSDDITTPTDIVPVVEM